MMKRSKRILKQTLTKTKRDSGDPKEPRSLLPRLTMLTMTLTERRTLMKTSEEARKSAAGADAAKTRKARKVRSATDCEEGASDSALIRKKLKVLDR